MQKVKFTPKKLFQGIGTAFATYGTIEGIGAVLGGGTITVLGGAAITASGGAVLMLASLGFITYVCVWGEKDNE